MFTFTATVAIGVPIRLGYDFHLNPINLRYILPWNQKIIDLRLPEKIEARQEIFLKVQYWGIPQTWVVSWEELTPPHGTPASAKIVDCAQQSPFSFWRHTHAFRETPSGMEMTDHIEYDLPFPFWHAVIHPFVAAQLHAMFTQRHRKTKLLLEQFQLEEQMRKLGLPIPEL